MSRLFSIAPYAKNDTPEGYDLWHIENELTELESKLTKLSEEDFNTLIRARDSIDAILIRRDWK